MAARIRLLTVHGIFSRQDITFDFSRSPFFIVGPNGTGKSTALKILHCVLTGQWAITATFPFVSVEIDFDDDSGIIIDRDDFRQVEQIVTLFKHVPRRPRRPFVYPLQLEDVRSLVVQGGGGRSRRISSSSLDAFAEIYPIVAPLLNSVDQNHRGRVLYFPTYRRVERDLGELFQSENPFDDDDLGILPSVVDRFKTAGEVVGFGGQDISKLLSDTAKSIEIAARQALNEHSVRFLEALADQNPNDTKLAKKLIRSESETNSLLSRISTFSDLSLDMDSVSRSINEIRALLSKRRPGRPNQVQEMMLIYIGELIKLFDKIEQLSSPLQKFASLLTRYLYPAKYAELNSANNTITISDVAGTVITADQLSSGEKQIIAFFAFLLLNSGSETRYIIIDEPELSLSVSWQKTLIADIKSISPDSYIVAATHSPFILRSTELRAWTRLVLYERVRQRPCRSL